MRQVRVHQEPRAARRGVRRRRRHRGRAPGPDYNVAPTKQVLAVVERHPRDDEGNPDPDTTERSVRVMRWGLVPHWAKDLSAPRR